MANVITVQGDLYAAGTLGCVTLAIPAGTLVNTHVNSAAAIDATKLQQQYVKGYTIEAGATVATTTAQYVLHTVYGLTGSLVSLQAGQKVVGTTNITVEVLKNTVTTAISTLTLGGTTQTACVVVESTTTNALQAGDVLTLKMYPSSTTTTLGAGFFAQIVVREDAD